MTRLTAITTLACVLALASCAHAEPHVYVRGAQGWTPAPARVGAGTVSVRLDPAVVGSQAAVLISETPLAVTAPSAPSVAALSLNGHEFRAPVPADLGFHPWPHSVALMLHDGGAPISEDSVKVSLVGERTGPATVPSAVVSFAGGTWVRATLDTRGLRAGRYTLRIGADDLLGHRLDTSFRFNSLGLAIPATTLRMLASSGRACKPLPEIGTQFYHGETPGDFVSYSLPVKRAGRYGISVHFTRCYSYGTYLVRLDGDREPCRLEGYDPDLRVGAGSVSLGVRDLAAGEHVLRFELTGHNPLAQSEYLGLSEIVLRPERGVPLQRPERGVPLRRPEPGIRRHLPRRCEP